MPQKLTKKKAEAALKAVKEQFKSYIDAGYNGPELIQDWEPYWGGNTIHFVIMWEDGPYDWAYRAKDGGYDEELSCLAECRMETKPATNWPEGVWCEPGNSFILALYPED